MFIHQFLNELKLERHRFFLCLDLSLDQGLRLFVSCILWTIDLSMFRKVLTLCFIAILFKCMYSSIFGATSVNNGSNGRLVIGGRASEHHLR